MKKIVNLVFSLFTNDSRAIKESTSLAASAYNVEVIAYLDRTIAKSKVSKLKAYLIYVKEIYNWEEQENVLVDIYKELNLCD